MIDVVQQVNAVRREVGSRMLEAGETRSITISQSYAASVDDVWDACTNPQRLARWFPPVSGDLRLGGHYQIEGNASGTIERCEPLKTFTATWEYGGSVSWIELRLNPEHEGHTRLELEHIVSADDERWAEFGPGALGIGWDMAFLGLANHLLSGDQADREDAANWIPSPDGRRFISDSGELWRDADVAAGATAPEAREAAARCKAAYTGAPQEPSV